MNIISKLIIPIVILYIIMTGLKSRTDIYNSFLDGAKDGLIIIFNIAPAILAMIFAVNIFLNSGFINIALKWLTGTFKQVIPMALLRPISGTASLAVLNDILIKYGPDNYIGRLASILQGCTDTTIYVLALYFGSVKITKTRYALPVGLFADLIGIIAAFVLTKIFFGMN